MKKTSLKQLEKLEAKLLKSNRAKEINTELAEEFLMADLYSGFHPFEQTKEESN